jgi:putative aldouronate transport system substrate-binding protein
MRQCGFYSATKKYQEVFDMKKKLVLSVCLMVSLLFVVYAGGGQSRSSQGTAVKPQISVMIMDRGLVPASEGSYENNRYTRYINENSPVNVSWIPVARWESRQKVSALFAAGNAPDVVWEFGKWFMDDLYYQQVIQPVGDYIEKYSVEYKQYLKSHPELMPYLVAEDGLQYGMSSARNITNIPNRALWIRQDWLKKFGMSIPANTDELLVYFRHVRDDDPDGNGIKDTFGLASDAGGDEFFKNLFGEPAGGFGLVNGHFEDWTTTAGYRDQLALRALLYKEGFMDPEYITDTNFTRQRQLLVTGKAGLWFGSWNIEGQWRELMQNVPTAELVPMEPFATTQGKHAVLQEPPAMKVVCMNKDAKDPSAIMKYMDWLISGGWWTLAFGMEGRHYRLVNGIPQVIDQDLNRTETYYLWQTTIDYALVDQYQPTLDWFAVQAADDPLSQAYVPIKVKSNEIALKYKYNRPIPYTPSSELINQFDAGTRAQITAIETNIVTGTISLDAGLRQINDYKKATGWDAVNAEKDAWYQKNKHLF